MSSNIYLEAGKFAKLKNRFAFLKNCQTQYKKAKSRNHVHENSPMFYLIYFKCLDLIDNRKYVFQLTRPVFSLLSRGNLVHEVNRSASTASINKVNLVNFNHNSNQHYKIKKSIIQTLKNESKSSIQIQQLFLHNWLI